MRILVAIDNSNYSQDAVHSLCQRLWHPNTKFLLVHVLEPVTSEYASMFMTYSTDYGRIVAERLTDAQKLVKENALYLKDKLPEASVENIVLEGPVKECLVEKARDWHADLIVMGSHGRKGLSKLMLGSVAESVLCESSCSVEIFKPVLSKQG